MKSKHPYTLRAFDIKENLTGDGWMVHEVEIGQAETIRKAMELAEKWSQKTITPLYQNEPFPLHLIYITEWYIDEDGDEEIVISRAYDEWKEDGK